MTDEERAQAAAALERLRPGTPVFAKATFGLVPEDAAHTTGDVEHRRGLDQVLRAGVEILHCKGVAFECPRTVEDATRTLRAAEEASAPTALRL